MDALQSEQASQREAISCFTAQLAAGDTDLQACMRAVEVMTEQHEVAGSQLHSVRMAMRGQQTHLTELAVECDRRHEAAMKIQHSAATETAILGQQVSTVRRKLYGRPAYCISPSSSSDVLCSLRRMVVIHIEGGLVCGTSAECIFWPQKPAGLDSHAWLLCAGHGRAGIAEGSDGCNEGGLAGPDRRCGSRHK